MTASTKLIGRLFEAEQWSFHVNDANTNEKASCFGKAPPLGIGIGLGNGEAFYIDLENFAGGTRCGRPGRSRTF